MPNKIRFFLNFVRLQYLSKNCSVFPDNKSPICWIIAILLVEINISIMVLFLNLGRKSFSCSLDNLETSISKLFSSNLEIKSLSFTLTEKLLPSATHNKLIFSLCNIKSLKTVSSLSSLLQATR